MCICILLIISLFYTKILPNLNQLSQKSEFTKFREVDTIEIGTSDVYTQIIGTAQNQNQLVVKAQTEGIVSKIKIKLGEQINKKDDLMVLSTSYFGKDYFEETIKLAKIELEKAQEEASSLKDIGKIEKEIANLATENFEETNDLQRSTINNIKEQISLLDNIMQDLESNLKNTSELDNQIKIALFQDQINSFSTDLKVLEYQASSRNPELEILENYEALVQREYQLRNSIAKLNVDIFKTKLELLEIQKSMRTPSSPIEGTIEKLFVKEGESVQINDDLVLINGELDMIVNIMVSANLASTIDTSKKALIDQSSQTYTAKIIHVSNIPTHNNLYEVTIKPENDFKEFFLVGQSIEIKVPLRHKSISDNKIYVPVDSIHIKNNQAYVYLIENYFAVIRQVEIGDIVANQIEVLNGLTESEVLILERSVLSGERVKPRKQIFLIDEILDQSDDEDEHEDNFEENLDEQD